jgi:hypothetical protein
MNINSVLQRLAYTSAINFFLSHKGLGLGALLESEDLGAYADPDQIGDYRYNPADGQWYQSPPAPDLGQWDWLVPADSGTNNVLNDLRNIRLRDNGIEHREPPPQIPWSVHDIFSSSRTAAPIRRDPLILDLDLDSDGFETVGIDTTAPILFDHDGDGVKTATGWVAGDDAFLVLDRNGNGTIDDGHELFGDATPLVAGGTAADGFAALAQEDSNNDGQVDALDAHFADLRLWRDLNQDGISQSDEQLTLASQGIVSLSTARTTNSTLLANGNQIADLGGFVRSDGTSGTLGAVEQLADVNLASDPFYSEFTDTIPLTEQVQALPDMQGSGMVRSLREAASLQTAEGNALGSLLAAFAAATTRSDFGVAVASTGLALDLRNISSQMAQGSIRREFREHDFRDEKSRMGGFYQRFIRSCNHDRCNH